MSTTPQPSSRSFPIPALLIGLGVLLIIGYLAWQMTSAATDSAVPAAASTLELLPAPSEPTPAEPAEEPSPESAEPSESTPGPTASEPAPSTPTEEPFSGADDEALPGDAGGDAYSSEEAALEQLAGYARGYDAIIPKNSQWVVQLSSKYVGVSDPLLTAANGTHTFYATDIVAEFEQIAQSVTSVQVVLLDSRTYGKQQLIDGKNLWVTFGLSDYFTSEDDVLSWCAGEFPYLEGRERLNVCMPTRLRPPNG